MPVFTFPLPTGPYAIGTRTCHWVDAPRAPYMQDADAVMAAFAHIHNKPAFLFSQFQYATINAVTSAPVASSQPRYPVLIFLDGVTGFRQMNTFQAEALASHGYIVVAIDQPGTAANVRFPDGREVAVLPVLQ